MKNKLNQPIEDLKELTKELTDMFDSKIVELNNVQGGQTERHSFMYYREKVYSIQEKIGELLDQTK